MEQSPPAFLFDIFEAFGQPKNTKIDIVFFQELHQTRAALLETLYTPEN